MTTPPPHPRVARRDLSILTAGIPALLGFHPANSLVLCTFNQGPLLTLGATMRADLPAPEHVEALTEHLLPAIKHNGAVAVLAVVVGGGTQEEHHPLVDTLRKALNDNDILLIHASWVNDIADDERWHCYLDPQCTDTIPDPQISAIAMADAVAGNVTFRTREEMASQLAPDPPETLARREELLDEQLRTPQPQYTEEDLDADVTLVTTLLTEAEESLELPTLTDRQVVRLARALSHPEIKDECMAAALTETPEAAERVWTILVRGLPSPERAEAAVLLAMSAYLRGAGVLAALAVRTALDANPGHGLARLLDTALTSAVPPDNMRALLIRSILKNEGMEDDDLFGMTTPATADPGRDGEPEQADQPERQAVRSECCAPAWQAERSERGGGMERPSRPKDTEPSGQARAAERSGLPGRQAVHLECCGSAWQAERSGLGSGLVQADQREQQAVRPEHCVPAQQAERAEHGGGLEQPSRPEGTEPSDQACGAGRPGLEQADRPGQRTVSLGYGVPARRARRPERGGGLERLGRAEGTEPSDQACAADRSGLPERVDRPGQQAVRPERWVPAWLTERPGRSEDREPSDRVWAVRSGAPKPQAVRPERPRSPEQDAVQPEPSASQLPTRLDVARLHEPFPAAFTPLSAPEPLVTIRGPAPCALNERTAATLGLLAPVRSAPLNPLAAFLPLWP